MKIDQVKAEKLERSPRAASPDNGSVTVVVKVRVPNYVPEGFKVRARLDEYMFTAECEQKNLDAADKDPNVEALSSGSDLRLIR